MRQIVALAIIILTILYHPQATDALPGAPDFLTQGLALTILLPEPGTVILLGLGLIGVGIFLMLRKH